MTAPAVCDRVNCPSPSHDTPSGFRHGCRSEAAYVSERRRAKANRLGLWKQRRVDNTGTVRRLQALAVMGWSSKELGARLGVSNSAINQLRSGRHGTNVRTVAKIAALYDELAMLPGNCHRTVADAHRKSWFGPLCWDNIDDPAEQPDAGGEDRQHDENVIEAVLAERVTWGDLTSADRNHLVDTLFRRGWALADIAERSAGGIDDIRRAHDRVRAKRKREAAA